MILKGCINGPFSVFSNEALPNRTLSKQRISHGHTETYPASPSVLPSRSA